MTRAVVAVQPYCPCGYALMAPERIAEWQTHRIRLTPGQMADLPVSVRCGSCGADVEATFWETQK